MDTTGSTQTSSDPQTEVAGQSSWHVRYASERRKARILGATTVAASLLAVGAGAWGLSNTGASATGPGQLRGPATGQFGPPGTAAQAPDIGQNLADMLFNGDGSVNEELLQQFVSRLPGGLDEFLRTAVANGELTQEQADALTDAAGAGTDEEQV